MNGKVTGKPCRKAAHKPLGDSCPSQKAAPTLVFLVLIYRYWFAGSMGMAGSSVFMDASLFMAIGLVLLADPLIDETFYCVVAKGTGYLVLLGHCLALLFG